MVDESRLDQLDAGRLPLIAELRTAIETRTLSVVYQPKAHLSSRLIIGVEALVRWDHPRYGSIPPDQFIPLAEQNGYLRPLTELVLEQTLHQCRSWCDLGTELSVAVNLPSAILLDNDLAEDIAEVLERIKVPPRLLTLEIAGSVMPTDPERAVEAMRDLAALGVRLSIDGFGSGYSAMPYLTRLPVHEVKIDKLFVLILTVDEDAATIVQSIISLARKLKLSVVAKGVEDAASLASLASLGCDMVQGYYLSRPVAAPELSAALVANGTALDNWMYRRRRGVVSS